MRHTIVDKLEDEKIIDRILEGEINLFDQLVDRYKNYIYTIALGILKIEEDAEEAAHDSFLKAYKNLAAFKRDSKFSTWLYRIVFNTSVSYKRKQKGRKENIEVITYSYGETPRSELEHEDQKTYIQLALSKMNETDRTVITLFYLKEFSLEEIAEITGMAFNNVKVRLHRARKKLADELKSLLRKEALNL